MILWMYICPANYPNFLYYKATYAKWLAKAIVVLLQLHNKYMNDKAINCDFYLVLSANSHYIGSIFMNVYAPNYGGVK